MHLDNIFQFIVPLTFLAIWALTSLINRESQPLPPRANRPPGPPGPRPATPLVPPRPPERRSEPPSLEPSLRWQATGSGDRQGGRRPSGRPDDDILIIESEPRRAPASSSPNRPGAGNAPRRATRARSAPPAAKRPEPPAPRALTATLAREAETQIGRHLELNPLGRAASPLATQELHDIGKVDQPATAPSAKAGDYLALLTSSARVREAVILNELLRPPLALRRPRIL
jgi:hypothetical protein